MAQPGNDEEREARRERRRRARERREGTDEPTSNIAEPTTDYRGSGEFDRETGLAHSIETGQMIPRNHFANEDEWAEYFATVPQEIKRAHREKARANQERVYAGLADGMSLADLGITDDKEHGRALYRRLSAYGLLDPNFEYNWETGQKRNVGTSDLTARNRWMPIDPSEYQERRTHQAAGGDFASRIRQDAGNRMNAAVNNGTFTRDPTTGLLYNDPDNDPSRRQYYDDRGYFIDPQTRERTGGGHSGFVYGGGRQSGAGTFGGVGGAWGQNTPAAQPPAAPARPYYRQPSNPWGTPGGGGFQLPSNSPSGPPPVSSGSAPSPISTNQPMNGPSPISTSPWRLRRTFGAPS